MYLRLAISFISAAVIGYEILLTRLFSIIQWHHFAYMIISLALLGFGASGTFLSLGRHWILPRWKPIFQVNGALFAISILGSFAVAQRIPFNALEIAWDVKQIFYLFGLSLLLTVPFFCAANCIGIALSQFREQIHRIYRFDLMGAGLGALGIIALLFFFTPSKSLQLISACAFLSLALLQLEESQRSWKRFVIWCSCGLAIMFLWPGSWIKPQLSEYKGLSYALRVPDTEVLAERSSPLGLMSVVKSPTIPFRYAPGLSLQNTQEPPEQLGLFTDGDAMTVITRYDGDPESLRYLDFMTAALPYHLSNNKSRVLILGAGGGADVLLALYHQAQDIDAVELNPQVIQLVRDTYGAFSGNIYASDQVHLHVAEARAFAARHQKSEKRYSLVQVSLLDSFGASSAGLHALNETYLYTVEAIEDYLALLEQEGLLAITRWLKVPPRDSLKLFATVIEALKNRGIENAKNHLALIRSWKTSTLLIKNGAFMEEEIDALKAFCDERAFDLAYYPGITAAEANRYNQLPAPYLYAGIQALFSDPGEFFEGYKFDVRPTTDERPYFFHFFKWRTLSEIISLKGRGGLPLLEWAYPILIATLVQALLASLLLILVPLLALKKQVVHRSRRCRTFLYFFALGLAFLFLEISFIQRFLLFLGHPLYAIAVVLCAFLVFAGLGSGYSARLADRCGGGRYGRLRTITLAAISIAAICLAYHWLLPLLFRSLLPVSDVGRVLVSLLLIAPLAFFMGMPFPLGLAIVGEREPALIPWAWGINGCASVISAVLATLLAIHFGFTVVVGTALALYLLAAVILRRNT